MKKLAITGKTYEYRSSLKKDGFRWNPSINGWIRSFDDDKMDLLKTLEKAYAENGLHTQIYTVSSTNPDEPRYFVKESWIFNLEAMHDKIWCLSYDIEEGKLQLPFTIAGKQINEVGDLFDLLDEAQKLECIAKSGKVTGRQYGRIKSLVAWRVEARYGACLAAGMSEKEAGKCFEDL